MRVVSRPGTAPRRARDGREGPPTGSRPLPVRWPDRLREFGQVREGAGELLTLQVAEGRECGLQLGKDLLVEPLQTRKERLVVQPQRGERDLLKLDVGDGHSREVGEELGMLVRELLGEHLRSRELPRDLQEVTP